MIHVEFGLRRYWRPAAWASRRCLSRRIIGDIGGVMCACRISRLGGRPRSAEYCLPDGFCSSEHTGFSASRTEKPWCSGCGATMPGRSGCGSASGVFHEKARVVSRPVRAAAAAVAAFLPHSHTPRSELIGMKHNCAGRVASADILALDPVCFQPGSKSNWEGIWIAGNVYGWAVADDLVHNRHYPPCGRRRTQTKLL